MSQFVVDPVDDLVLGGSVDGHAVESRFGFDSLLLVVEIRGHALQLGLGLL